MVVELPSTALAPFSWFSLYNSPYVAHRYRAAIDLYPPGARNPRPGDATETGGPAPDPIRVPSPVAGQVLETQSVRAPSRPYAADRDHLVLVDVGDHIARLMHVEPAVEPGDMIRVGDPLGRLIRSGYFSPWVGHHLHLEFRQPEANPRRATGSLRLEPSVPVVGVRWDGTASVVETGGTYAILDRPAHPSPGERFAAIATDGGRPLDGGVVHYETGGLLGGQDRTSAVGTSESRGIGGAVSLLGTEIGRVSGREVAWNDVAVRANGEPVTGLSLAAGREALGAKLVWPDHQLSVGDRVAVTVRSGTPSEAA